MRLRLVGATLLSAAVLTVAGCGETERAQQPAVKQDAARLRPDVSAFDTANDKAAKTADATAATDRANKASGVLEGAANKAASEAASAANVANAAKQANAAEVAKTNSSVRPGTPTAGGESATGSGLPADWTSALRSAEAHNAQYALSKQEIYALLVSGEGGGYLPAAAQYAVDNLAANYHDNALQAALHYQETEFLTPAEIYDELLASGFTVDEAQYAINNL